jgi:hypothetical protein
VTGGEQWRAPDLRFHALLIRGSWVRAPRGPPDRLAGADRVSVPRGCPEHSIEVGGALRGGVVSARQVVRLARGRVILEERRSPTEHVAAVSATTVAIATDRCGCSPTMAPAAAVPAEPAVIFSAPTPKTHRGHAARRRHAHASRQDHRPPLRQRTRGRILVRARSHAVELAYPRGTASTAYPTESGRVRGRGLGRRRLCVRRRRGSRSRTRVRI